MHGLEPGGLALAATPRLVGAGRCVRPAADRPIPGLDTPVQVWDDAVCCRADTPVRPYKANICGTTEMCVQMLCATTGPALG